MSNTNNKTAAKLRLKEFLTREWTLTRLAGHDICRGVYCGETRVATIAGNPGAIEHLINAANDVRLSTKRKDAE